MSSASTDEIGEFGLLSARRHLSLPVDEYRRPLFRALPLADKTPIVDLLVEVLGDHSRTLGWFLAQVKATTKRFKSRLPVRIDSERYDRLAALPIPAYIIGVAVDLDDPARDRSYVAATTPLTASKIVSIPTRHQLQQNRTRIQLYEEVCAFWGNVPSRRRSAFEDD